MGADQICKKEKVPDKLVFEVVVEIDSTQISRLRGPQELMIPFSGTVQGELFSGRAHPGGVGTQTIDQNGVRHMAARYMFEGVDKNGEQCRIYIDNNGWFTGEMVIPTH
ncbi:MAG: DUF3237 family protein [Dehalococcoidales bacterium]